MRFATIISVSLIVSFLADDGLAANIYVDNVNGYDGNDGLAETEVTRLTGPVRSFRRALHLLNRGDAIIINNTGVPYRDSLFLSGARHSGTPNQPLVIYGNNAVLSGQAPIPSDGWYRQPDGLWRLSFTRKGHYRFFRDDQPFPEQQFADSKWAASDLKVNHWASQRGAVYFQLDPDVTPYEQDWSYAAAEIGISLVDVRHVRIMNLEIAGYRTDGINADNACRDVQLENVYLHDHGRAGLAVGGSAQVRAIGCRMVQNSRYSVLITERGSLQLEQSDLGGVEPIVLP